MSEISNGQEDGMSGKEHSGNNNRREARDFAAILFLSFNRVWGKRGGNADGQQTGY